MGSLDQLNKSEAKIRRPLWYAQALAMSLMLYSQLNREFQMNFLDLVSVLPRSRKSKNLNVLSSSEILLPIDLNDAMARAEWLVEGILLRSLPGSVSANESLTAWREGKIKGDPKLVVVGMVVVAIPGVTMGRISRRKTMALISRADFLEKNKIDFAKKANAAAAGIISRTFEIAHGHIGGLEPDVQEWLLGDKASAFFAASENKLLKIKKEIMEAGIVHSISQDEEGKDAIIAISPAADSSSVQIRWNLDPVSE